MNLVLAATILISTSAFAAGSACALYMTQSSLNGALTELARMRLNLDRAQAAGFRSSLQKTLNEDFEHAYEGLVAASGIPRESVRALLLEEVRRVQLQEPVEPATSRREEVRLPSVDPEVGVFHPVSKGTLTYDDPDFPRTAEIDEAFEMMSTPVTQALWRRVAELIARRSTGSDEYKVDPDPSLVKGDARPVENIAPVVIFKWLAGLNWLSRLDDPGLYALFPGHTRAAYYTLPTMNEWQWVARGEKPGQLEESAWFAENSDGQSHDVAGRQPIVKGGFEFFDLFGNIGEYVRHYYAKDNLGKELTWVCGGCYMDSAETLQRPRPHLEVPINQSGLRLVRKESL